MHVRKIKGTGKKVGVIRESEKFGVPKFVVQLYMFYFGCLDLDQGFDVWYATTTNFYIITVEYFVEFVILRKVFVYYVKKISTNFCRIVLLTGKFNQIMTFIHSVFVLGLLL